MLRIGAEHVRVSEAWILCCDATPHVPSTAGLDVRRPSRGRGLRTHGGVLHAAAVGDEHQVIIGQVDAAGRAVGFGQVDARGRLTRRRAVGIAWIGTVFGLLFEDRVLPGSSALTHGTHASADGECDVLHLHVVVELHAEAFQILDHRQDHRLVLVVAGETQRAEIGQAADVVDVTADVQLHFQCAMPVLEGEHGAPVHPEVRIEHLVVEEVGNLLAVQLLVRREEQLHDLHRGLVGKRELAVRAAVGAAGLGGAAQREVRILLVEPVVLIQYGNALGLDGGDGTEQIPHHFEMVVHLTSAAHHIAQSRDVHAIAGAAGDRVLLEHMDVAAGHLRVAYQIAGRAQGGKSGADDVGVLVVDSLGLLRPGERFVIAVGIVHDFLLWTSLGTIVPRRWAQVYGHELDAMSNFVDVGGISLIGGGFRLCAKVILPICGRFSLQKVVRG